MNLVLYLVYGRDKTFNMQSMNAYRQLKAFKFFYDGFVKNVWLYQCPVNRIVLHNERLTSSRFREILKRRTTIDLTKLVIDIMGYT